MDLVLLFQNIYHFPEDQRPDLLRRLHGLWPTARQELDRQHHHAGFTTTQGMQLIPLASLHAVVAER